MQSVYSKELIDKISSLIKSNLKLHLDVINDSEATIVGYGRGAGDTVFASKDVIAIFGLEFGKHN